MGRDAAQALSERPGDLVGRMQGQVHRPFLHLTGLPPQGYQGKHWA